MFTYTRIITDDEEKILGHDLLDIKDWIDQAVIGKINNCLKRAANEYRAILKAEGADSVPVDDTKAFVQFTKRMDYKNRSDREILAANLIGKKP